MNYYITRFVQAIITFFSSMTIAFALYRLMPGGPVESMKTQLIRERVQEGQTIDIEQINAIAEQYTGINPNEPIWSAYIDYIAGIVLEGDFGTSLNFGQPVFDVLFAAMPWSIFVSVYGLLSGWTVMILLGTLMAYKEGSKFDKGATVFVLSLGSIPYYIGAVIMLAVFAFEYGWFPTGGRYNPALDPGFNIDFMMSVAHHGALPILTGFILGFGGGALGMRANSIRLLGSEYLHSARIRGISNTRIITRYIGRNAILPIYTGFMIGIAGIFSSSVIMEQIFAYPGVGWYTFEALVVADYPLLMGSFIFFVGITVIGILLADLTYGLIDPRAGSGSDREAF